jgi:hypothetical protein
MMVLSEDLMFQDRVLICCGWGEASDVAPFVEDPDGVASSVKFIELG